MSICSTFSPENISNLSQLCWIRRCSTFPSVSKEFHEQRDDQNSLYMRGKKEIYPGFNQKVIGKKTLIHLFIIFLDTNKQPEYIITSGHTLPIKL